MAIILLLLAIPPVALGALIWKSAESSIHEIAALLCFLIVAVLVSGAFVTDRVGAVVRELRRQRKEADKRRKAAAASSAAPQFEQIHA